MQSVSSRIWTRVAVSISYDDKELHHGHLHYFADLNIAILNVLDCSFPYFLLLAFEDHSN